MTKKIFIIMVMMLMLSGLTAQDFLSKLYIDLGYGTGMTNMAMTQVNLDQYSETPLYQRFGGRVGYSLRNNLYLTGEYDLSFYSREFSKSGVSETISFTNNYLGLGVLWYYKDFIQVSQSVGYNFGYMNFEGRASSGGNSMEYADTMDMDGAFAIRTAVAYDFFKNEKHSLLVGAEYFAHSNSVIPDIDQNPSYSNWTVGGFIKYRYREITSGQRPRMRVARYPERQIQQEVVRDDWEENVHKVMMNHPTYVSSEGARYKGEVDRRGRPSGYGAYYKQNDNSLYVGQWVDGRRNGFGIQLQKGGQTYIGYWQNNQKTGRGRLYDSGGRLIYVGDFANDTPIGNFPYGNDLNAHQFRVRQINDNNFLVGETANGRLRGWVLNSSPDYLSLRHFNAGGRSSRIIFIDRETGVVRTNEDDIHRLERELNNELNRRGR